MRPSGISHAATDFLPAERARWRDTSLAIIDDENFAEIFAPGSRAEVPIVGRIARAGRGPIPVAGQVDRLAVTGDTVLIADYKTDRIVPDRLDETHPYVDPAGALPRSAGPGLPGKNRARGAAVHRWAEAHGSARRGDGRGVRRSFPQAYRPMTRGSRRGEAPLTPFGSVHRFIGPACRILLKQ